MLVYVYKYLSVFSYKLILCKYDSTTAKMCVCVLIKNNGTSIRLRRNGVNKCFWNIAGILLGSYNISIIHAMIKILQDTTDDRKFI